MDSSLTEANKTKVLDTEITQTLKITMDMMFKIQIIQVLIRDSIKSPIISLKQMIKTTSIAEGDVDMQTIIQLTKDHTTLTSDQHSIK